MIDVPADLRQNIVYWHGPAGAAWIEGLPAMVAGVEERLRIRCDRVLDGGEVSLVAEVTCADGTPAILKVALRDSENDLEHHALALLAGRRVVRMLAYDKAAHAILLERLEPGTSLRAAVPDEETGFQIAAELLPDIWIRPPLRHRFRDIADLARVTAGRLPARARASSVKPSGDLVDRAVSDLRALAVDRTDRVLLHRDYHRLNVLAHGDGFRIIDPKPVIGDRAFDLGCLFRDDADSVLADPQPARRLARRVDLLCELLAVDRERALSWAVAWGLELALDDWPEMLRVVELLDGLR
jgi:streptomycin 6-kinase